MYYCKDPGWRVIGPGAPISGSLHAEPGSLAEGFVACVARAIWILLNVVTSVLSVCGHASVLRPLQLKQQQRGIDELAETPSSSCYPLLDPSHRSLWEFMTERSPRKTAELAPAEDRPMMVLLARPPYEFVKTSSY